MPDVSPLIISRLWLLSMGNVPGFVSVYLEANRKAHPPALIHSIGVKVQLHVWSRTCRLASYLCHAPVPAWSPQMTFMTYRQGTRRYILRQTAVRDKDHVLGEERHSASPCPSSCRCGKGREVGSEAVTERRISASPLKAGDFPTHSKPPPLLFFWLYLHMRLHLVSLSRP